MSPHHAASELHIHIKSCCPETSSQNRMHVSGSIAHLHRRYRSAYTSIGTPAAPAVPGTPGIGDHVGAGTSLPAIDGIQQAASPSQQAATTPPVTPKGMERKSLRLVYPVLQNERVKNKSLQTQEAVVQLTSLVRRTMEGLQSLHERLTASTESQRLMKEEVKPLQSKWGTMELPQNSSFQV